MALDAHRDREPVADVDHARALTRADEHPRRLGREPLQVDPRRLVGAVLRPHHRVHGELEMGRFAPELVDHRRELVVGHPELPVQWLLRTRSPAPPRPQATDRRRSWFGVLRPAGVPPLPPRRARPSVRGCRRRRSGRGAGRPGSAPHDVLAFSRAEVHARRLGLRRRLGRDPSVADRLSPLDTRGRRPEGRSLPRTVGSSGRDNANASPIPFCPGRCPDIWSVLPTLGRSPPHMRGVPMPPRTKKRSMSDRAQGGARRRSQPFPFGRALSGSVGSAQAEAGPQADGRERQEAAGAGVGIVEDGEWGTPSRTDPAAAQPGSRDGRHAGGRARHQRARRRNSSSRRSATRPARSITYGAWREFGVPPEVLRKAGISRGTA